ncbi:MAG: 50S ribosomal protein L25 [Bacteroidetes bacterium]|jgi:large subunit ribosomal protein L25|nr:50S ribosomal protein L25 [Bacteroidota bacterium]
MESIAFTGQPRTELGKKSTREIRKAGNIPCVAYGGGDAVHFVVTPNDVKDLIYTPEFKLAEITVDGQTFKAFVKDLQFHPVTDAIEHIDFLRLVEGHPVKVDVPIRFKGVSPGVKNGGKLIQRLRRIRIKTKPENLVSEMEVDISGLKINDSIRIREIDQKLETIEILNSPGVPIASVETPRALRSATAAAAKEGEAEAVAEGEEAAEGEGEEATEE